MLLCSPRLTKVTLPQGRQWQGPLHLPVHKAGADISNGNRRGVGWISSCLAPALHEMSPLARFGNSREPRWVHVRTLTYPRNIAHYRPRATLAAAGIQSTKLRRQQKINTTALSDSWNRLSVTPVWLSCCPAGSLQRKRRKQRASTSSALSTQTPCRVLAIPSGPDPPQAAAPSPPMAGSQSRSPLLAGAQSDRPSAHRHTASIITVLSTRAGQNLPEPSRAPSLPPSLPLSRRTDGQSRRRAWRSPPGLPPSLLERSAMSSAPANRRVAGGGRAGTKPLPRYVGDAAGCGAAGTGRVVPVPTGEGRGHVAVPARLARAL